MSARASRERKIVSFQRSAGSRAISRIVVAALSLVLFPVAVAACGCENGCFTRFENLTDLTVQFLRVSGDGRETPINRPVESGGSFGFGWDDAFLADCKDGAWIARSEADGTEVARWDRPEDRGPGGYGRCPMNWVIGAQSTVFYNYTPSTVQVVSIDRNGRETLVGAPIKSGTYLEADWRGFSADCPNGAWIARTASDGREIARWDRPTRQNGDVGPCPGSWQVREATPTPRSSG